MSKALNITATAKGKIPIPPLVAVIVKEPAIKAGRICINVKL